MLRKHVEVLRRVSGQASTCDIGDVPRLPGRRPREVLRIAQEALGNALRHARARRIDRCTATTVRALVVADDGAGFDPGAAARPPARADVDARAGDGARRGRWRSGRRPARGRRCGWSVALRRRSATLLVDDHAVVRAGLRTFLDLQDDMEVVGEAGDGEEAVAAARRLTPEVVLLDLVMPGLDGLGAIRRLRDGDPSPG